MVLNTIKDEFGLAVGYSDHTQGITIPIAAAALGASIIEKHFTIDSKMDGPDHLSSLEPSELNAMVLAIRDIEKSLGNGIKTPSESECKNIQIVRKSLIAETIIKKGELFSTKNIGIKRPGSGISPFKYWKIVGSKANKDYGIGDLIEG